MKMFSSELSSTLTWREVVFTRSDGSQHSELVEGTSPYDAVFRALELIARPWWFIDDEPIMVRELRQVAEYPLAGAVVDYRHHAGRNSN
jgi:hypothetical protein